MSNDDITDSKRAHVVNATVFMPYPNRPAGWITLELPKNLMTSENPQLQR
jgi:hypothetical protein